jgi:hypothetical protein
MSTDPWKFPRLVHIPSRKGRKPVSIPDITQFSEITRNLFGVECETPTEVYSCSTYNEVRFCHGYDINFNLIPAFPSAT